MYGENYIEGVEGIHHTRYSDDRGYFQELLRVDDKEFEKFGQWSLSYMYQGVTKAWHIHKIQTDYFFVPVGVLKVVLWDKRKSSTYNEVQEIILDINNNAIILKIPPGVAHGVKVLQGPCMLMYITSEVYNPDDEGRIPYNAVLLDKDGAWLNSIAYDWTKESEIK